MERSYSSIDRAHTTKAIEEQATRGCFLGHGVIIGHQGKNLWIAFAGRCYLVAPEHLRGLAPDENASLRPLLRHGLEQLKQASKSDDYIGLSGQDPSAEDLASALLQPAGTDPEGGAPDPLPSVPEDPVQQLEPEPSVPCAEANAAEGGEPNPPANNEAEKKEEDGDKKDEGGADGGAGGGPRGGGL